jgi:hypothetical protein
MLNFTLNSISSYRGKVQQWDSQVFTVHEQMTRDDMTHDEITRDEMGATK